jgi:stage II sporulation protein M
MKFRQMVISVALTWAFFLAGMLLGSQVVLQASSHSISSAQLVPGLKFWQILPNNILAAGAILITSTITLGLLGAIVIFINGIIVGELVRAALVAHWHLSTIVLALIPHGILEITSSGLFLTVGMWWSYCVFVHLFFRAPWPSDAAVKRSLHQLLSALLLLLSAGFIESFITPLLVR